MNIVRLDDFKLNTIDFGKYEFSINRIVENKFNNDIKNENFLINTPVYWKILSGLSQNLQSWQKGTCLFDSMQHLIIRHGDGIYEEDYGRMIGFKVACVEDEGLAYYLTIQDHQKFKSNLFHPQEKNINILFPDVDFSKGVPEHIYKNKNLFSEQVLDKINFINKNNEHYENNYLNAKNHPEFYFINFKEKEIINYTAKYFIFDLNNSNESDIKKIEEVLRRIKKIKNNDFFVGYIGDENLKKHLSCAIINFNNN